MPRTIYVTCPLCGGMLEVHAETGKVVRRFPKRESGESGDTLTDALKDIREGAARREEKFREAQEKERDKIDRLETAFREKRKEVEESGDTSRPLRPIDME
ncbi:MAG: hypothetical protein PHN82_00390 [bacterium]|nr:hypothetical protein [bacterium]